ncbi:MAG: TetR/AcrR family transcriptional regulator [Spirochaetaceae bacterium]
MKSRKVIILDAANELISRVGLNAMSYKHLSDIVGINKSSIHHHFPKKEKLVEELLERCQHIYGSRYRTIVSSSNSPAQKLKLLANVFADGLINNKLCMVGTFSSDRNSLNDCSKGILEVTIEQTVSIYAVVFKQGKDDGSLKYTGTDQQIAYTFFSFLIGLQISARAYGGIDLFNSSVEIMINSLLT